MQTAAPTTTEITPAPAADKTDKPNAALVREEFNGATRQTSIEMQATALAAKAKATIESRYVLAMRKPRNLQTVRVKLLEECRDPFFADEAIYAVPRGREQNAKGEWVDVIVEDLSIRFAEAAARYMGNLLVEAPVVLETPDQRVVQILVTDLEVNLTYDLDVVIAKTRERKNLRMNEVELSRRFTSSGKLVYIVATPDSELTNQVAAAVSKAVRTLVLRMIPAGIKAECKATCDTVLADKHAKNPAAERNKLCDGFARMGVEPHEVAEYIGRPLELITPAEFRHLVALGVALRDGNITWADAMEGRTKTGKPVAVPDPTPPAASTAPATPPAEVAAAAVPATAAPATTTQPTPTTPAAAPVATPASPAPTTKPPPAAAAATTTSPPATAPASSSPAPAAAAATSTPKPGGTAGAKAAIKGKNAAASAPKPEQPPLAVVPPPAPAPAPPPAPAAPTGPAIDLDKLEEQQPAPPPDDDDMPDWMRGR